MLPGLKSDVIFFLLAKAQTSPEMQKEAETLMREAKSSTALKPSTSTLLKINCVFVRRLSAVPLQTQLRIILHPGVSVCAHRSLPRLWVTSPAGC